MSDLPSSSEHRSKLGPADATELAAGVAQLTKAGLPLPAGFRALADEVSSRRLRGALSEMAERLERGDSIEAAMDSASNRLPPNLYGLLLVGLRSGQFPEIMEEFLQAEESHRILRQRLRLSLAYPILLTFVLAAIVIVINKCIAGSFEKIFKDFGTGLPEISTAFLVLLPYLQWVILGFSAFLFVLPLLASDAPGFVWLSPLIYRIPLLGTLLKYTRWAIFSKLTALLLRQNMPLPEVFRLAAKGVSDPYLRRGCRKTAFEVENGRGLSDSMQSKRCFPPSLIPFIAWGEKSAALPEAFSSTHELYADRAESQTTSFMAIAVPFVFFSIILFAALAVIAIIMPLLSLITSLTGEPGHLMHGLNQPHTDAIDGAIVILVLGILFLFVNAVLFWPHWSPKRHPFEFCVKIFAWGVGFWGTACLLFVYVNAVLGFFWLVLIPFIALFAGLQNYRIKRRGLLRMLSLAVDKKIPLAPALDAYAREAGGKFGDRILELSAMLQNGMPLPNALQMVSDVIPADQYPIICSGYESGDLARGLREATTPDVLKSVWGPVSAKMLYVVGMICFLSSWAIFFLVKIFPSYEKIVKDHGAKLPDTSLVFLALGRFSVLIMPVLILVFLFFLFLFFYSLLKCSGIITIDLPGLGRILRRKHSAAILDNLAMSVENHRSIDAGLKTLARFYPNLSIRQKLGQSLLEVQSGCSWLESLFRLELIGSYDFAVLQAAERAGNLSWAMRETAFSNRRRLATRVNLLAQLLFPPVVICFGGVILFVVMAAFMPLVNLIQRS